MGLELLTKIKVAKLPLIPYPSLDPCSQLITLLCFEEKNYKKLHCVLEEFLFSNQTCSFRNIKDHKMGKGPVGKTKKTHVLSHVSFIS